MIKRIINVILVLSIMMSMAFVLEISAVDSVTSDEGRVPFEDVKDNHWFAEAVKFCYANNVINGMNEYTFGWNGQLTRAQFVMMLSNLEGIDTSAYTVTKFTDVKSTHWYYGAVAWAYEKGIVNGMTDTTFVPNGVLTRAQLATVMRNYMKDKYTVEVDDSVLDKFSDKPKAEYWYYEAMKYAVSAGLLSGMSNGTLSSTGNVTRAQAAVIFKNFMEQYYFGTCEHVFSEANCTNAAVCEACGLVNGLPNGHILIAYDCVTGGRCTVCDTEVEPSIILHNFAAATCTEARTCTRCQVTRGEANGHNWKVATCTEPKTCTVCKATEGWYTGHSWQNRTCTKPKTCIKCGITEGSPSGHFGGGIRCGRCGEYLFDSYFSLLKNNIKSRKYDAENNAYSFTHSLSNNHVSMYYYIDEDVLILENIRILSDTDFDVIQVELVEDATTYEYVYMYFSGDEMTFMGVGALSPATFTNATQESFDEYLGVLENKYQLRLNNILREMLMDAREVLANLGGCYIKDIGFTAFKY